MTEPAGLGLAAPGEWVNHSRCWMAWPCREEVFHGAIEPARTAFAEVARTIAKFEPVTMVCQSEDAAEASLACGAGIQVLPMPISDSWIRDTGPTFLTDGLGSIAGVQWWFNAWGGMYSDYDADAVLARGLLEHLGLPVFDAPLVLEGGAICVDGEGTLLCTEQCLLDRRRNPGLDRGEVEEVLKGFTGAKTVIWLGEGYQDDETLGHVDEVACFVRPGVVLALVTEDPGDGNFRALQDNLDRLRRTRDAAGRELEVVTVRQPERQDRDGRRLTMSYTNLYLANGGVLVPSFEDAADHEAFKLIRRLWPEREVVPIPALDIVRGGGGLHCITLGQPAPG